MGRSPFDGVSDGEWSVFAEKVVAERDALRQQLAAEREARNLLAQRVNERLAANMELQAALDAERQKRCGTCQWWLNDRCHCGVTCPVHLRWVPSDFGCPHWRERRMDKAEDRTDLTVHRSPEWLGRGKEDK